MEELKTPKNTFRPLTFSEIKNTFFKDLNLLTKKFIKAKFYRTSSSCYFKGFFTKLSWMDGYKLEAYTRVWNVCRGWPVYGVKHLCSRGRGNERGRGAIPTSISIFDFFVMKTLWFKFGYSKCQDFKVEMPIFQPFYDIKLMTSNFNVLAFCSQWR